MKTHWFPGTQITFSRLLSQLLSFFLTTLIKTAAYRPTITVRSSLLLVLISAMNCFPPLTLQHLICYGIIWWKTVSTEWDTADLVGWLNCLFIYLFKWLSGPGSSPGWGHCVVFLGKTLYSHSASLHPGVQMGTSKYVGGNSAMD